MTAAPANPTPSPDRPGPVRLTFYTKAHCPLCERLALLVDPHLRGLAREHGVRWTECDITTDEAWLARYGERVPVLVCDGRVILEGRPDSDEVAVAIARLTAV